MCFDFVKPFWMQIHLSSHLTKMPVLPHFISSLQTAVDNHTSINCCRSWIWSWRGRKWDRKKKSLELIKKQQFVCMGCEFNCNDEMVLNVGVSQPLPPTLSVGGSISHTKQYLMFTVHYVCLKVFTFGNVELGLGVHWLYKGTTTA